MTSRTFRSLVLVVIAGLVLTVGAGVQAASQQDEPAGTPIPMTLPQNENPAAVELKKGEGSELVMNNCLTCHTLNPIVTHDGFTPDVWASEVNKMRERYGAEITDEDAEGIIKYLSTYYSDTPASVEDTLINGINAEPATPGVEAATPMASPKPNTQPSD